MNFLEKIIESRLGRDTINKIDIKLDENSDGESVLWIDVVLNADRELTSEQMSDLTNALWTASRKEVSQPFPVLNYVSADDYLGGEAA